MRLRSFCGALFFATICCLPLARAQVNFDLGIGFGTARDASNNMGIDNLNSVNPLNESGPCNPNDGDIYCQKTTALSGFDLGFMGDWMITKRYGVGAEITVTPAHQNYMQPPVSSAAILPGQAVSPLEYRQEFFDFNGIVDPINQKRFQLQIQGGIGVSHTGLALNESGCVASICTSAFEPIGSANHFQLHVGVGLMIFVTEHLFVKPQVDLHYVPNLTAQFNSVLVPQYMVWVGYGWH